ncbi:hypothetical protein [Actimicrobium antarcticum]|uniref:Phage tail tape measure protein n=1 Tax=Actimicrobium antarcticum TaxID=1051899 RepID=A0ABP7SV90_9BURK
MSKIGNFFHKITEGIKNAFESCVNAVKAAINTVGDTFKSLMKHTLALLEAVATGDVEQVGKCFLQLGTDMADLATLPESAAANAAMEIVKGAMKTAAETMGMSDQPWMKKVLKGISLASNFTSLGNAAEFAGTEILALATGSETQTEQALHDIT